VSRLTASGLLIGRVLKLTKCPKGYLGVGLSRLGIEKSRQVHQLVAEAFIGPCPEGQEVRHGPNGKLDNRASQLCYGTRRDNKADQLRDGTLNRGELHGKHKLRDADIGDIRRRVAAGEVQRAIAREYGVCFQTICLIASRKTWRHIA
jgi:hypothetical protein